MFHDGRIQRLDKYEITTPDMKFPEPDALAGNNLVQAQARFPITSKEEMRGEFMDTSLNQTLRPWPCRKTTKKTGLMSLEKASVNRMQQQMS